jgi:hypothetical protein
MSLVEWWLDDRSRKGKGFIMCTPALRELKRRNPACRVTFYTDFPSVVDGLPFIDQVRPTAERPVNAIYLANPAGAGHGHR